MVHYEYVCDACGFASEEEQGVYKCPKCGNQMRAAKRGAYSGDSSPVMGRWIITLICFFVFMVFGIVLLGPLGIVIAFVLTFFVWRFFRKASRDNAKRIK